MRERQEILDYGMTLPDVYIDTPFRDDNWVLLRYKKNQRAFAWTYERGGYFCVNVKVDPQWREFWRNTYEAVIPGYHQNKEHWNTIILNGTIPETEIKRMIAESYDLVAKQGRKNSKNAISALKETEKLKNNGGNHAVKIDRSSNRTEDEKYS